MKAFWIVGLVAAIVSLKFPCWANDLAVGKSAQTGGPINIQIVPPTEFNFKTRAQIFAMRNAEVMKHADLLTGKMYAPNDAVFGRMVDGRPWWGMVDQAYYGKGKKSILGQSIRSLYILNPFLLAGVAATPELPKDRITESDLFRKSYPLFISASDLTWCPQVGKAEVTYEVSSWEREWCQLFGYSSCTFFGFGLDMSNAHDLGLNYVYIPPSSAYNMRIGAPMKVTMANPQFIHCGGSCGYPGGCNNMSPTTPQLNDFAISKLPARLVILFWKNAPTTGREEADVIFTMNFR